MNFWEDWVVTPKLKNSRHSKKWRKDNPERAKENDHLNKIKYYNELRNTQMPSNEEISLVNTAVEYIIIRGIYMLWLENELQYIGSSENIAHREILHRIGVKGRRIKFDSITYIPYNKPDMQELEYRLINHYNPPLNKLKLTYNR